MNAKANKLSTKKESNKFIQLEVEGLAMYASVHKPKKGFLPTDAPRYSLDLIVEEKEANKLLELGAKVAKTKVDEDTKKPKTYAQHPGKKVFMFTKPTMARDGSLLSPPAVVDSQNNPVPATILIGNGSKVLLNVSINSETGAKYLNALQILELVPYERSSSPFSARSGFSVNTNSGQELKQEEKNNNSDNQESPY